MKRTMLFAPAVLALHFFLIWTGGTPRPKKHLVIRLGENNPGGQAGRTDLQELEAWVMLSNLAYL